MDCLVATMYVEINIRTGMEAFEARGVAQIKQSAWDHLMKNPAGKKSFLRIWNGVAHSGAVPKGPGSSPVADMVFLAAWTLKRDGDCKIGSWKKGH